MHSFHGADVILITVACSHSCQLQAPSSSEMSFLRLVQTAAGLQSLALLFLCVWLHVGG